MCNFPFLPGLQYLPAFPSRHNDDNTISPYAIFATCAIRQFPVGPSAFRSPFLAGEQCTSICLLVCHLLFVIFNCISNSRLFMWSASDGIEL